MTFTSTIRPSAAAGDRTVGMQVRQFDGGMSIEEEVRGTMRETRMTAAQLYADYTAKRKAGHPSLVRWYTIRLDALRGM